MPDNDHGPVSTREGSIVAGRFRIGRTLGSGGMAEVFEATDIATRQPVALKLLRPEIAQNREAVQRLRREGEVLTALRHPSIVRIETFGQLEDDRIFIAMELLSGETLGQRMRRISRMEPADLSPIVDGACAALAAAHESGVVHRDLKPDNIFLCEGPSGIHVKLLDFGISKVFGSDKLTQTGEVVGTPRYMAPEQLSADRDLDGRTDIYALGVILYEALAGSPPFLASTPTDLIVAILHGKAAPLRSFRPDLVGDVETVVTRAMSRARDARYASAHQLLAAWSAITAKVAVAPVPARPALQTAPMGSMNVAEPIVSRAPAEALRPGTFSELPQAPVPASPIQAPAVPVAAPPFVAESAPVAARPEHATRLSRPGTPPKFPVQVLPAASTTAHTPTTDELRLPTHSGRVWLIVGGLVAGALSALIAILVLHYLTTVGAEPAAAEPAAAEHAPGAPPQPVPTAP